MKDEDLLKKAKEGDKEAFELFYNKHKRRILNYIYRMIGNFEAAEELAQDAFIKAYINLSRYNPKGKPLNWVYTIAGNLCKNFLRDKKHEPKLVLNKELPEAEGLSLQDVIASKEISPSDLAMGKELEFLIQEHIDKLPIKYREPLVLCDIQGFSYEEAAKILNCKSGSVGSRLSRARELLAKTLGKYFLSRFNDKR